MKILIVDDEKDLTNLIRVNLESEGFECIVAYNGAEGIEKVANELPDLILLDIKMPVMDGYEVLEELKEHHQTASIPVIMCTTVRGEENIKKAYELGASGYIIKPFEMYEIVEKIQEMTNLKGS